MLNRKLVFFSLSILVLGILASRAEAQGQWCTPAQDAPAGCAEVRLSPANLSGDFYLGAARLAQAQNTAQLTLPSGTQILTIRNIQSTELYFGSLFIYPDMDATLTTAPGQILHTVIYPRRQYIRGLLTVTCDVRGAESTDDLGCLVLVDGTEQAGRIAPGQKQSYVLDLGEHTITVRLGGAAAEFWSPPEREMRVAMLAGRTAYFSPLFDKKGQLSLILSQPTARADFYVDGTLIAQQAAAAELWVDPDQAYAVEVRTISDTDSGGLYGWHDARQVAFISAGQSRAVKFWLRKHYLKGFFELTCAVSDLPAGQSASCVPVIDGTEFRHVQAGRAETFALPLGVHTVSVSAAPGGLWTRAEPYQWSITLREGGTVRRIASWRTALPGEGALPAYTTPGRVVFASSAGGSWDIYLMNGDGSGRVNLTNHPARDASPAWSPDGRRIVFESDRDGSGDLYVMESDGSNVTQLTSAPGWERDPVWSRDGMTIVYVTEINGNQDIAVINADGSNGRLLTLDPADDFSPALSPDGKRIVFASRRDGDEDLYVMNADGTAVANLTNYTGRPNTLNRSPSWSPDGRYLFFETNRAGGSPDLWIIDFADGSAARAWSPYPRYKLDAAWSPNGQRVIFAYAEGSAIWIADADGTHPSVLSSFNGYDFDWTP